MVVGSMSSLILFILVSVEEVVVFIVKVIEGYYLVLLRGITRTINNTRITFNNLSPKID